MMIGTSLHPATATQAPSTSAISKRKRLNEEDAVINSFLASSEGEHDDATRYYQQHHQEQEEEGRKLEEVEQDMPDPDALANGHFENNGGDNGYFYYTTAMQRASPAAAVYSPQSSRQPKATTSTATTPSPSPQQQSRQILQSQGNSSALKQCANCGARNTPTWRRCPEGKLLLCNACGLYIKNHHAHRQIIRGPDGQIRVARLFAGGSPGQKKLSSNGNKGSHHTGRDYHAQALTNNNSNVWLPCQGCALMLVVPMTALIRQSPILCEACWSASHHSQQLNNNPSSYKQ